MEPPDCLRCARLAESQRAWAPFCFFELFLRSNVGILENTFAPATREPISIIVSTDAGSWAKLLHAVRKCALQGFLACASRAAGRGNGRPVGADASRRAARAGEAPIGSMAARRIFRGRPSAHLRGGGASVVRGGRQPEERCSVRGASLRNSAQGGSRLTDVGGREDGQRGL